MSRFVSKSVYQKADEGGGGGGGESGCISQKSKSKTEMNGEDLLKPYVSAGVNSSVSVLVSVSVPDGIVVLGNVYMHPTLSLCIFPKVTLRTVLMFVWLNTDHS